MAQTDLKIRRIKMYNPMQKKFGFATRAIINGTETFESVAEEAARNTTLNKYELVAALGIAAEQFARALKNGWAVDLGPIGKIYPTVSSKWTETAEEQTKALLKPSVRFDPSADIKGAVESAKLTWVKDTGEVVEEEVVEEDVEMGGSTGSVQKYTVAWYQPNGNPIVWYELAPGEVIPEAPPCPEGYYWHPYPSTMPNHDLDIIPEPNKG